MLGVSIIYCPYNAYFRNDQSIKSKILFLMVLLHESMMKIKRRSELTILIRAKGSKGGPQQVIGNKKKELKIRAWGLELQFNR